MFQILFLLLPAVICAQHYRKSTNPNDEPFLPIHPEYPYNPKLMKRGLEQQQVQQSQALAQLSPELYAPKVDARDTYSASFSQAPLYPSYDPYSKASTTPNALANSPYYQSSYSTYGANPYNLLNSYGTPFGTPANSYTPGTPSGPSAAAPGYGASPYGASSAYPFYYYPSQSPYYYPNYYGQPPYPPPPPPGYPGGPSKHQSEEDDEEEDDRRREKNKKSNNNKNKLRNSDRDTADNQYVDGANYIISSAKDLDTESSSHRTPSHYNQIEQDSDVQSRAVSIPKTYRLVSVSGQQGADYNSGSSGYIKIQQLEQLMRQALARLLAQNAAQQANLAQIQQEVSQHQSTKDNQQYLTVPNTIAKTGLSYVVNPTILNRVTPGQYNPSQLLSTLSNNKQPYSQKPATSITLQHSPGIYIPPGKGSNDQSSPPEYGDYDSSETATTRNQQNPGNYPATAEPTRNNYSYSTYRPTQQTNLDDVNFGSKQKTKS